MTITTVGYGDKYPVTNAGRIVGIFVMTAGVGLFGTLSGFLANKLLTPPTEAGKLRQPEAVEARKPRQRDTCGNPCGSNDPKARISELKRMLEAQEQAMADLRAKLQEFDKSL